MPYTVKLRTTMFERAAKLAGLTSDYALAQVMGVNPSTIGRVRSGNLQPGAAFIAGAPVTSHRCNLKICSRLGLVSVLLPNLLFQGNEKGTLMSTTTTPTEQFTAALSYAALGWPVVPGAVWCDGHFADPVDERLVTSPCLRPIGEATTDAALVQEWWSTPGLHAPNVFIVTGTEVGAFAVAESLTMTLADNPWFAAFPTPVLAFPNMPIAYFLVRSPMPSVLLSHEAHVMEAGMPMPLPPSALDTTPVMWLVTPEQAGNRLMPGDALADLIYSVERKCA